MIDNLLRMRLFVAIYEEGTFTAAAVRENLTQSGATQHVQKLEEFLGVKLFARRSGNTMHATPAADAYYVHCVKVLRAHAQARVAVKPFATERDGELQVGLTPTLTRSVLAPTLAAFLKRHPNVVVRVLDAYSDLVLEKVRVGDVDFAVVPGACAATGLRSKRFASVPEFLLSGARAGHRQTNGMPVRLRELGPLKLVVPSRAQARRATLEEYLDQSGAIIERKLEIDTALGAIDFIQHSDWHSIHPSVATLPELRDANFIINPLTDPPLMLELFHVERASDVLSPQATAFAEELSAQLQLALATVAEILAAMQATKSRCIDN